MRISITHFNTVSLSEISVRPEILVEGFYVSSWRFDRLTTNGKSNSIVTHLVVLHSARTINLETSVDRLAGYLIT